jgi:RNA polymerase sigma factor (sigma-70 family)
MEELKTLIQRTQDGEPDAFGIIVQRFQDMAVGYAYSILGDFHLAEDAAQEAFIEAYRCLPKLREPDAFSSWFRKIVFKHCDRLTRKRRIETIPLEEVTEVPSSQKGPPEIVEEKEMKVNVLRAIAELPEKERMVTTLFYINGYSREEIGEFLSVTTKTVKNQLYSARNRLREKLMTMVKDDLQTKRPSRNNQFALTVQLFTAVEMGKLAKIKELLSIAPDLVNVKNSNGKTLLHIAAYYGYKEVMELLLSRGIAVDARDYSGRTPLHHMVLGCNQPDVAQLLLNHGAVIHTTDNQSTTPVSLATNHWKEKLTQFLLDKGAVRDIFIATIRDEPEEVEAMLSADSTLVNVRQKTCYPMAGATPLHIAVGKSHWDVAQILLKYGADVNALDDYGRPPMYFAAHDTVIYKMHPPQEMVQLLLEHGATLDIFSYALLGQTNQVNQLLLSAPHLANASDAGGNTPLHLAAWNGKKEMVELLIAKGALVNAQNKSGQTPIMLAGSRIRQNSGPKSCDLGYEIGEYLLFHGAICDIFTAAAIGAVEQINACLQEDAALLNATNDEGLSPLQVAACVPQAGMFGYELPANANELPSVKFLLECGAFLDIFAAAL